jgi:uncharacterized protein YutD
VIKVIIKTEKAIFQLKKNYRDAFVLDAFNDKYIEECMDKYPYIVGDISSNILRLKGFDNDPNSKNYYKNIDEYLKTSCALGCPYYVLYRLKSEEQYQKLPQEKKKVITNQGFEVTPIEKENFDKESLVLSSTPKVKSKIVLNMQKINSIPKGELTDDLKEFVKNDKQQEKSSAKPQEEVQTTSYVSASPDFDPSKSNSAKFNKMNNNHNNKHKNKNNHNKNKNKN